MEYMTQEEYKAYRQSLRDQGYPPHVWMESTVLMPEVEPPFGTSYDLLSTPMQDFIKGFGKWK
jgi:hypothetical protein